jgi:hypothetical protein
MHEEIRPANDCGDRRQPNQDEALVVVPPVGDAIDELRSFVEPSRLLCL